jgi:hypothetical protein
MQELNIRLDLLATIKCDCTKKGKFIVVMKQSIDHKYFSYTCPKCGKVHNTHAKQG